MVLVDLRIVHERFHGREVRISHAQTVVAHRVSTAEHDMLAVWGVLGVEAGLELGPFEKDLGLAAAIGCDAFDLGPRDRVCPALIEEVDDPPSIR